ncbi:MAG TPA: phosphoribosylformylglycinamidine synthase subunit PurS [Geobacteraceae bacterium]|nr:phosphoribosylformylglycinamidine synthase subunit PurS [Geobacteraceae bacterium]
MAHRIEVALKDHVRDPRGDRISREIDHFFHMPGVSVRTIDVYTVDAQLTDDSLAKAASEPFSDPIIQFFTIDSPAAKDFDFVVEVGYRPGVTDNVGRTAKEAIEYITGMPFKAGEGVYTSVQYLLKGSLTGENAETIATGLLCNTLIQRYQVIDHDSYEKQGGFKPIVPKVSGRTKAEVREIDLNVPDEELVRISKDGVLALTLEEMRIIQAHFRDEKVIDDRKKWGMPPCPTDVELEALAQTWSEHCKHKIFSGIIEYVNEQGNREEINSLFKTFIQGATKKVRENLGENDYCLSVFKDNAGVIKFNDQFSLVFKVETHNSPSALDPYGGALTGIVGVNRDPFGTGKGARLIFNTDVFCFASPFYEKPLPSRLLHPRRIYEGVVEGVEHGGNKSGIPTVNGSLVFDDRFAGKPLVFCGTAGIMPAVINGEPSHLKIINPGDVIVMTGGRIGKDGIHGATFSSEELSESSPVSAVQIGDPITQKRMTDFLLRARDRGLYNFITDNGAGGLSSSIGEMARECGGCRLDLEKAPLKYPGLDPWEILISEAQERMSLAVPPEKLEEFLDMSGRMGVEASVLGEFTDSGYFHILYGEKTVARLPISFLHEGLPPMKMTGVWEMKRHAEPGPADAQDFTEDLKALLCSLNVCSKESVVRRYDHEVQGGSVVKPFTGADNDGPSDAAVIRPVLESFEGVVVAHGISPRYSDIDTYHMMANAIDEGLRNYVAVGGSLDLVAGLDNFCWCDPIKSDKTPDGEYKMAQLVRANKALYEYCVAFGIPLISGKDSMKNDFYDGTTKISIPPTVLFSVIGKIDDARKAVTMDAKRPGDIIYLLGKTAFELGGSEYYASKGFVGNRVPRVDAEKSLKRYRAYHEAVKRGLVASCHDLSDGGLAVALAEKAFAGGLGLSVDLGRVLFSGVSCDRRDEVLLFSETASRHLVTVRPEDRENFEEVMTGNCFSSIGVVVEEKTLTVSGIDGSVVLKADIEDLKEAWQSPLREM